MKTRLIYERSVNLLASSLAMVAQRLPFLKSLTPIFGTAGSANFAAPLTVTFLGTHSLSGQSIMVLPTGGAVNPADTKVGAEFVWSFRSSRHTMRSTKIEFDGAEQLPAGLSLTGPQGGIATIGGIPTEPGEFTVKITGYRFVNQGGQATAPFLLTLNVAPGENPLTPYEEFVATFWTGDDLDNELLVGEFADPDGDGIKNVMEFVLDLDPTKPDAMPGSFQVDPEDSAKMRYEIPLNVAANATKVVFEEGTNLESDWAEVPSESVTRTDDAIVLSTSISGKKFYRLRVVIE